MSVSHDTDDFAVHDTFAVTDNSLPLAAAEVNVRSLPPSDSSTVPDPVCFTVYVAVFPPPATVIFPVRVPDPVFAATLYVIFPLPFPDAVLSVSHDTDDFAVHDTLAVTPSSLEVAAAEENVRSLPPSSSLTTIPS